MNKYLLILLVAVVAVGGCSRCEKEEPKPDPCASVLPASAKFQAYETYAVSPTDTLFDKSYDCDTLTHVNVTLNALGTNLISYKWYIGSEVYTTKSVSLGGYPVDVKIPIKLVVKRSKSPCLADSQLTDSVTRNIIVIDSWRKKKVSGRFRGYYNGNPADTVTLTIIPDSIHYYGDNPVYWFYTHNFVRNISSPNKGDFYWASYRQITFGIDQGYAQSPDGLFNYGCYGRAVLDLNNNLKSVFTRITYSFNPETKEFKLVKTEKMVFIGKKISTWP